MVTSYKALNGEWGKSKWRALFKNKTKQPIIKKQNRIYLVNYYLQHSDVDSSLNSKPTYYKELYWRNLLDNQNEALIYRVTLKIVFHFGCQPSLPAHFAVINVLHYSTLIHINCNDFLRKFNLIFKFKCVTVTTMKGSPISWSLL